MASAGYRVLSEIVRGRLMRAATQAGLKAEMFQDPLERKLFEYILLYWKSKETRKQYPTTELIKRKHPWFDVLDIDKDVGQIESLVDTLRVTSADSDLTTVMREVNDLLAAQQTEEAMDMLVKSIPKMAYRFKDKAGSGFGVEEIVDGTINAYEGAKKGTTFGVPWKWECLTIDTQGKKPGELVCFYGRMKSMKTWLLLASAAYDFEEQKQRVLVWSKEMSMEQLQLRLGAIFAKVDYQLLKKGLLPRKKLNEANARMKELRDRMFVSVDERARGSRTGIPDILVVAGRSAPSTVIELGALIEEWQPDVVYIDSFYHLKTARAEKERQMWASIQMLAEDLKDLATGCRIPIIIAAQANRLGEKLAGENLTEVAGSDAIARECDLIIRVLRKVDPELSEEDYEGEFEKESKVTDAYRARLKTLKTLPANAMKLRSIGIPKKALAPDTKETLKRKGAELCLVLGGNREGTLEAFTIKCVPGYRFDVEKADLTYKEVKKWVKSDDEAAVKEVSKALDRDKAQRAMNPAGAFPKA